jgi:regulator of CtrA degradation
LGPDPVAPRPEAVPEGLPRTLTLLLDRSSRLYERICHLDRRMYLETEGAAAPAHPVLAQFERLKGAFGA